jgi:hypothetical protein
MENCKYITLHYNTLCIFLMSFNVNSYLRHVVFKAVGFNIIQQGAKFPVARWPLETKYFSLAIGNWPLL